VQVIHVILNGLLAVRILQKLTKLTKPNHSRDARPFTKTVRPFGRGKAVGETPTAAVGTTGLPSKSLRIGETHESTERD
jgi:hypothetical protein